MTNPNGDKARSERLLDGLVKELQTMSDTEVLEGQDPQELVRLGEHLLEQARKEAGQMRLEAARRRLSFVAESGTPGAAPSVEIARKYLQSLPEITLAARSLNELSDEDVLDLFSQAKSLEDSQEDTKE